MNTRTDTQPPSQRDTYLWSHRKMYLFAIRENSREYFLLERKFLSRKGWDIYSRNRMCEQISFPPYYIWVFPRIFFSSLAYLVKKKDHMSFKLKRNFSCINCFNKPLVRPLELVLPTNAHSIPFLDKAWCHYLSSEIAKAIVAGSSPRVIRVRRAAAEARTATA